MKRSWIADPIWALWREASFPACPPPHHHLVSPQLNRRNADCVVSSTNSEVNCYAISAYTCYFCFLISFQLSFGTISIFQYFVLIHFQFYPFFVMRDRVSKLHKINEQAEQRKQRLGQVSVTHLRSEPTPNGRDTTYCIGTTSVVNHRLKIFRYLKFKMFVFGTQNTFLEKEPNVSFFKETFHKSPHQYLYCGPSTIHTCSSWTQTQITTRINRKRIVYFFNMSFPFLSITLVLILECQMPLNL